jgi:uncharacterized CHY-type Zn-finger protein
MADFCRKCNEELFGHDFADKITYDIPKDSYLILLCEGCGRNVRIDNKGNILECNTCIFGDEGTCNNCYGVEGSTTEIAGGDICQNFKKRTK